MSVKTSLEIDFNEVAKLCNQADAVLKKEPATLIPVRADILFALCWVFGQERERQLNTRRQANIKRLEENPRTPITVEGKPLSEVILEDRGEK